MYVANQRKAYYEKRPTSCSLVSLSRDKPCGLNLVSDTIRLQLMCKVQFSMFSSRRSSYNLWEYRNYITIYATCNPAMALSNRFYLTHLPQRTFWWNRLTLKRGEIPSFQLSLTRFFTLNRFYRLILREIHFEYALNREYYGYLIITPRLL